MDLSTPDTPRPDPLTAATARDPKPLAGGLIAVGLAGVLACAYFAYLAYTGGRPATPAAEGAEPVGRLVSAGHAAAALVGLAVALAGLGVGVAALARVPADDPRRRLTDARTLILQGGGVLGLIAMAAGAFYLAYTFDVLTAWVDTKTPPKGAWKPVASVLAVLAGAGLAFLAALPARAEERNNPFLRRLVYGGNLALSSLLLLLALVVGNVLAGLKVPNKLDTTEGGFYSLAEATKTYLAELTKPVQLYTTVSEGDSRLDSDIRALLDAMRESNPGKVTVVPLSPTLNRREIADLGSRFPQADLRSSFGVLVAVGEKGKEEASAFVRDTDMLDRGAGRGDAPSFSGESKVVKELLFLTEQKSKPVVYALAGHGELEVVPDPAGGATAVGRGRAATRVRTALEKVNAEVRSLVLPVSAPKVPDDAAVMLVLDPTGPVGAAEAQALREYATKPRADGKFGKLVVATSPRPKPDRTGVAATGLEELLAGFGVRLGAEYLCTQPLQGLGYRDVLAAPSARLEQSGNPIAAEFASRNLILSNCRELVLAPAPPGAGGPTAELLFGSAPGPITWLEADPPANPAKLLDDLLADPDQQQRKRASQRRPRVVGAIASEGGAGRLAVFASGEAFADPTGRPGPADDAPPDLLAFTVNWLRDRPAVANISNKDYRTYTLPRTASDVQLVWLPVGATLAGVLALGLGVWVFRRK